MSTDPTTKPGSGQIDDIVAIHKGWKGDLVTQLRTLVKQADPDVVEEVKWRMRSRPEGVPVWSHDGILCIIEIFKDNLKLVFFKGAFMEEMQHYFNARLKSSGVRAIEFHDGDKPDKTVITKLVQEAVRLNELKARAKK